MANNDPVHLRQRAEQYERMAQRITDDQTLAVLHGMAREYRERADALTATSVIVAAQRQSTRSGD